MRSWQVSSKRCCSSGDRQVEAYTARKRAVEESAPKSKLPMPTPFEVRKAAFGSGRYWRGRAGIGDVSSPRHSFTAVGQESRAPLHLPLTGRTAPARSRIRAAAMNLGGADEEMCDGPQHPLEDRQVVQRRGHRRRQADRERDRNRPGPANPPASGQYLPAPRLGRMVRGRGKAPAEVGAHKVRYADDAIARAPSHIAYV